MTRWAEYPSYKRNNPVGGFIRPFVVLVGRLHEAKIHIKLCTTSRNVFRHALCGLFADVGLLLKVDIAKGVILEHWRRANNMLREDVELMFTGRTKSKHPNLWFYLSCFGSRSKSGRGATNVGDFWGNSAMTPTVHRLNTHCKNIRGAIVEALMIFEIKSQREASATACKMEAARGGRVLASDLSPVVELIRSGQDLCGWYYCFNHVRTIVAGLIIRHAIGKGKRQKALFCNSIIKWRGGSIQCNRDSHRWDDHQVNQEM
jgi:hypothetical protein